MQNFSVYMILAKRNLNRVHEMFTCKRRCETNFDLQFLNALAWPPFWIWESILSYKNGMVCFYLFVNHSTTTGLIGMTIYRPVFVLIVHIQYSTFYMTAIKMTSPQVSLHDFLS